MPKRSAGLREPAYNHLLNLIMTKQLMPGERIPETRIAKEFNISRTPVRDAMRQLSNDSQRFRESFQVPGQPLGT